MYFRCHNYIDKYYDRLQRGEKLCAVAPNYRITELQSAVGIAQFDRLDSITESRNRHGDALTSMIRDIPCLTHHVVYDHNRSSYWFYMFRLKPNMLKVDRERFVNALIAEGIPARAGYIPRPVYLEKLFTEKSFFPGGIWPAEVVSGKSYVYNEGLCTLAEEILKTAVIVPINEFYTEQDIIDIGNAIIKISDAYTS